MTFISSEAAYFFCNPNSRRILSNFHLYHGCHKEFVSNPNILPREIQTSAETNVPVQDVENISRELGPCTGDQQPFLSLSTQSVAGAPPTGSLKSPQGDAVSIGRDPEYLG